MAGFRRAVSVPREKTSNNDEQVRMRNRATMARLLDMRQVAEELNLGRSTVFALVAREELRSVKIGRRRLVPRTALEEYLSRLGA